MTRRWATLLIGCAGLTLTAALVLYGYARFASVPQQPSDPIAIRASADGNVEVAVDPCVTGPIERVQIRATKDAVFDDDDPHVWDVRPTEETKIISTESSGGGVSIPWEGLQTLKGAGLSIQVDVPRRSLSTIVEADDLKPGSAVVAGKASTSSGFLQFMNKTC